MYSVAGFTELNRMESANLQDHKGQEYPTS